jgi:hypothetical protein
MRRGKVMPRANHAVGPLAAGIGLVLLLMVAVAQQVADVRTGPEFVAACAKQAVDIIRVQVQFLEVNDADFAGYQTPIVLRRNLTVTTAANAGLRDMADVYLSANMKARRAQLQLGAAPLS